MSETATTKKMLVEKLINLEERFAVQEKRTDSNEGTIKTIQNIFWIVLAAAITTAVGLLVTNAMTKQQQIPYNEYHQSAPIIPGK
jgi:hypothetical protein